MVRVVKLAALIAIAIGLTAPAVANASGGDGVAKPRPHTPRAARTAHVAPGDAEELPAELYQWIQVPGPAEVPRALLRRAYSAAWPDAGGGAGASG